MQTLENKVITPVEGVRSNNIELDGTLLLELLEGVSTHAGRDKSLPVLNSLEIEGGGGLFTARATDRYRLIEGGARALEGSLDKSLISLEDTKRIITLLKAHKSHLIGLTRIGNALTVSALGDAVTFTLVEGTFPPTGELFTKSEGEPSPIEGVAFNPALMADYAKIAGKGAGIKIYFTGEGKPMRVRITSDTINWRALLMPMRYKD
jgi:DNA polymerase III sliding clamp (beta) subunit (PCNA family)